MTINLSSFTTDEIREWGFEVGTHDAGATCDLIVACADRIAKLEKTFGHYHIRARERGDTCGRCGLDLRDPIHSREQPDSGEAKPDQLPPGYDRESSRWICHSCGRNAWFQEQIDHTPDCPFAQQGESCETCGGSGTVYTHPDETEIGCPPGSSARPCPDCSQ